jgi:hypothetical protein
MRSPVFSESQRQMTLQLDEGLVDRHASLRDCVAACIHRTGLTRVADTLDVSRGNLSVALSPDPHRKFGLDELEQYIQTFGDKTPIFYLVAKYLGDEAAARDQALSQVQDMLANLPAMLAAAGFDQGTKRRGR